MFDNPAPFPAWHYRNIPDLPAFDESRPLFVYDGVCVLCSGLVQFIMRIDRQRHIQFTAAQDPLGQVLFRHYGYDHVDFETNLLIKDGRVYDRLAVFCQVMRLMPWPWKALAITALIPPPLNRWIYNFVARNRYRLFGKKDRCMIPSPGQHDRFI